MSEAKRSNFKIEPVVLAWFFVSGMAALVYQVIWARELELIFGSTLYAVSTILSVFMAGLALGSIIFGKIADRHASPLRLYGYIELGIGAYAILTPWAFKLLAISQQALPESLRAGGAGFNPFSFFFSLIILIIPTTFMGGTLPILSRAVIRSYRELGRKVSALYFINTLGATTGAFLAGFVLIALFGMTVSTSIAGLLNILIGASAMWIHKLQSRQPPVAAAEARSQESATVHTTVPRALAFILLVGYGLAGFAALGLEVLWTRVLILVIGSSVYAFSLMLTAILMGIAVGSLIGVKLVDRARNLWLWFAAIELVLGLAVIVTSPVLGEAQLYFFNIFSNYQDSFNNLLFVEFLVIFLILMVPTTLMGLAFPFASKIYATDLKTLSSHIGKIYASNTIGAILGPLAVSFLLIPAIGIQKSIMQMSYLYLAIGAAVIVGLYWRRVVVKIVLPVSLAGVIILVNSVVPAWNELVVTSGVYYQVNSYTDRTGNMTPREIMTSRQLLFYKEGQLATVSVLQGRGGQKVLMINGKVDASSSTDLGTQLLVAHMPLLLHKDPQNVLAIGLGSGITLGAILKHPQVKKVDMVEIEPAVVDGARFFSVENNNALSDPRTNMIVNDARNFVISTSEKYDVISAEPSNPWVSHSSTMFSKEVFELYKKIIKDDGIVMQWFHLYRMGNEDLKMIIKTFTSVFPHTTLWGKANSPDIILIGSPRPLSLDFREFSQRLKVEGVAQDLARIESSDIFQMLSYFLMDEKNLAAYAGDRRENTDDHPRLEFSAPRNLYSSTIGLNLESMNGYRTSALAVLPGVTDPGVRALIENDYQARERAIQGQIYKEYGDWERAEVEWEKSLAFNPMFAVSRESLSEWLEYKGEWALQQGDRQRAFYFFTRASELTPQRTSPHINLARTANAGKEIQLALIHYGQAALLSPDDSYVNYGLGNAYSDLGRHEKAIEHYNLAIKADPGYAHAYGNRAFSYNRLGRQEEALSDYAAAISLDPKFVEAYTNRGLIYYHRQEPAMALPDFSKAIELNPTANNYDFRALALIASQRYDEALLDVIKANAVDPSLPLPWYRRGFILEKQGKTAEAIAAYERFLAISDDADMVLEARVAITRLQR